MPLTQFHPAVQRWFSSRFDAPSPPQAAGWPLIRAGQDTLICAPTGSGKTLTAFMACLDELFRDAAAGRLEERTYAIYVSPLKALSNDIEKNLREPLAGIYAAAEEMGILAPEIRVVVRTGDTLQSERQAMIKRPPHILVTTPESLYILLTAERSRKFLSSARTVIVDEIHAVARDKRGAHLALTLERLDALCGRPLQRIGLSATQRPIERVAHFLVGARGEPAITTGATGGSPARVDAPGGGTGGQAASGTQLAGVMLRPRCAIVNQGHLRKIELSTEIPSSPLEAVCSHETWGEIYERLTQLINQNRTTLIFVNTRRLCERLAQHLSQRLGDDKVTSHHGSLSRTARLDAEQRLKNGELKALVATASLELGIDIGSIDLVCQIGVTNSINALLQRAGRSGHSLTGISKAKLFPLTIDELGTAAALSSAIQRGFLDELQTPPQPLDILAQQLVAAAAAEEWDEDELYALVKRAYNYRELSRKDFDEVVQMLAEGFSTRRGRKAALLHYDGVGRRITARRGSRLAAITSGGAIPDTADYQVVQEPQGIVVGTLNEDFAVESTPGEIFQLGNTSWKILKVEPGRVRVEDAHGQPPSIPFWLGEAPARTDALTEELSRVRAEIERRFENVPWASRPQKSTGGTVGATGGLPASADALPGTGSKLPVAPVASDEIPASPRLPVSVSDDPLEAAIAYVMQACGFERPAAEQLVQHYYLGKKALGTLPKLGTLILERFFDEAGGMQLVLHAPYGRRIMWAWGLALRKRFCRGFNFELQAAASENALLLSLGPQHSFPLADVFHYLRASTVEDLLLQAALEAPVFPTRWRWDAMRALALLRFTGGKKVPPQIQRMRSDDLMAAVFPHAAACPENLEGDREVPDHPLVREVVYDCLHEAMDIDGLRAVLRDIDDGKMTLVAKDTTEPSVLAHEILTAKPYSFLDDAPLEERRTQAVMMRRGGSIDDAKDLAALDADAIARVREEAWPEPQSADELHDALMMLTYLAAAECAPFAALLDALTACGRVTQARGPHGPPLLVPTERVPLFEAVYGSLTLTPSVEVPPRERAKTWTAESALIEILRGRLEAIGPTTTEALAAQLGLAHSAVVAAMVGLETQGTAMRGSFTPGFKGQEWCDRRLLARIHRYTLDRLRREIEAVSAADYMRFLFNWQHAQPAAQLEGPQGLREALSQLQGCEIAAVAWERDVLPLRVKGYDRRWLDHLSLSGEVQWGRRFPPAPDPDKRHSGIVRHAPMGIFLREQLDLWLSFAPADAANEAHLSSAARQVLELLRKRGAVFFQNLVRDTQRLPTEIEAALGELVAFGFVTGDGFGGLRALLTPAAKRDRIHRRRKAYSERATLGYSVPPTARGGMASLEAAGRWSLFRGDGGTLFDLMGTTATGATGGSSASVRTPVAPGTGSKLPVAPASQRLPEISHAAVELVARQLLQRWGVVFHKVILREAGLPPWRDILRIYRRMEARGELRGGRFVAGFSGEQYALPLAVESLRAIRKTDPDNRLISVSGADPLNLAGIITPGDRVAARSSSRIVYRNGVPVAIKEAREVRILERDTAPAATREIYAALIRKAI